MNASRRRPSIAGALTFVVLAACLTRATAASADVVGATVKAR